LASGRSHAGWWGLAVAEKFGCRVGVHMRAGGVWLLRDGGFGDAASFACWSLGGLVFWVSCVVAAMTLLPHALATQFVFANGYDTAGKAARSCWRWYESCVR